MSADIVDDRYLNYEDRLATFQKTTKKRGSAANGRGAKVLNWPHKQIAPASLAKAGFYFNPAPENPDNATCFLCQKGLDGWEDGDDPLLEHITHSSQCGWAIICAVEACLDGYEKEDPLQPSMIAARKATFAGRWPHDGKRGWKCKTKQLVDAGWRYAPSTESDDMATCAHCQLALDGWEQNDKPYEEHFNRAPECPFFALSSQFQATRKKGGRSKASRASKASRLSMQSVATVASDITTLTDATAGPEDSVLTTTSTKQGGKKTKGKKATTTKAKSRKTKAKKEDSEEAAEEDTAAAEETIPSPPRKATRGRKRASEAIDESTATAPEAPAPKRRNTRARETDIQTDITTINEDTEMIEAPKPKKAPARKKGRAASTAKKGRKTSSGSNASMVSMASLKDAPDGFPDDDEIERQLQADLERQWSEDEDEISADPETQRANNERRKSEHSLEASQTAPKSAEYAMFDPSPVEDNDNVDDELKALEAEMAVQEQKVDPSPEPEQLHVPKKGRKATAAGARKASKQTKAQKAKPKAMSPDPLEEDAPPTQHSQRDSELEDGRDISLGSTDTVVKGGKSAQGRQSKVGRSRLSKATLASHDSFDEVDLVEPDELVDEEQPVVTSKSVEPEEQTKPKAKASRGRAAKTSTGSGTAKKGDETQQVEPAPKRGRGRPPKNAKVEPELEPEPAGVSASTTAKDGVHVQDELVQEPDDVDVLEDPAPTPETPELQIAEDEELSPTPTPAAQRQEPIHSTPDHGVSPAASTGQAAPSPSQSPQASDAENQPPSSVAPPSTTTKRIPLAPVAETPTRVSPSKRNMIAGLQSTTPWSTIDLDAVLGTPRGGFGKENTAERLLKQGSELTSPEKKMTVEEWVYFNAGEAEKKLKHECESMVSKFESEGTRAMNVLEGLAVE